MRQPRDCCGSERGSCSAPSPPASPPALQFPRSPRAGSERSESRPSDQRLLPQSRPRQVPARLRAGDSEPLLRGWKWRCRSRRVAVPAEHPPAPPGGRPGLGAEGSPRYRAGSGWQRKHDAGREAPGGVTRPTPSAAASLFRRTGALMSHAMPVLLGLTASSLSRFLLPAKQPAAASEG